MERSKKGQTLDFITILVGIFLTLIYLLKSEYVVSLMMAGLTVSCICSYKIKYKYNKLI
jgi:hypothetical protein